MFFLASVSKEKGMRIAAMPDDMQAVYFVCQGCSAIQVQHCA